MFRYGKPLITCTCYAKVRMSQTQKKKKKKKKSQFAKFRHVTVIGRGIQFRFGNLYLPFHIFDKFSNALYQIKDKNELFFKILQMQI